MKISFDTNSDSYDDALSAVRASYGIPLGVSDEPNTSGIGSPGPGGGTVFFDAGAQQNWGRYLEVAPDGWSGEGADLNMMEIDPDELKDVEAWPAFNETRAEIGTGLTNTRHIIQQVKSSAAHVCVTYRGGACDDWFLPSVDELTALYVVNSRVGIFEIGDYYYSSSLNDETGWGIFPWLVNFGNGYRNTVDEGLERLVRPIRAF